MEEEYLEHHGILGMHWGIRRYQNPDGTLTDAGRRRLEKKDTKWAKKNYNKITNNAYKQSKKEMREYTKELNKEISPLNKSGKLSMTYVNAYNQKLAELMNTKVSDLMSPSGRAVKFIAKRGEVGVHLALADQGYNMEAVKNGIYATGKIAYKNKNVDMQ